MAEEFSRYGENGVIERGGRKEAGKAWAAGVSAEVNGSVSEVGEERGLVQALVLESCGVDFFLRDGYDAPMGVDFVILFLVKS